MTRLHFFNFWYFLKVFGLKLSPKNDIITQVTILNLFDHWFSKFSILDNLVKGLKLKATTLFTFAAQKMYNLNQEPFFAQWSSRPVEINKRPLTIFVRTILDTHYNTYVGKVKTLPDAVILNEELTCFILLWKWLWYKLQKYWSYQFYSHHSPFTKV